VFQEKEELLKKEHAYVDQGEIERVPGNGFAGLEYV
jgi:hypothetical protein